MGFGEILMKELKIEKLEKDKILDHWKEVPATAAAMLGYEKA